MVDIRCAPTRDLDAVRLHDVLRLRQDVFVVEQRCLYADLDGRDLDLDTRQVWAEHDGAVVATLRVLGGAGPARIGRVATAPTSRGRGIAAAMMTVALEATSGPVVLDAQSHLQHWYASFGFVATGEEYLEDGIPHVPMLLDR